MAGAVLAHAVLCAVAFVVGAVFGCSAPIIMHPNGGSQHGPIRYGFAGGGTALECVAILYIFTLGIAPAVVTVIGAGLALGIGWLRRFCRSRSGNGVSH